MIIPYKERVNTEMTDFASLGLNEQLLAGIQKLGFTEPTEIQHKAIPLLLQGTRDFVGLAQTGTGKTAAFGLPLLQLLDAAGKAPQALVVCPTRELCMQIVKDLQAFSKSGWPLKILPVYGGASIMVQMRELKSTVHVVVATPGRLIDLLERKAIDLSKICYVVLDEADEMLNMGFKEDIETILEYTPGRNSMWLFSATMPPAIRSVAKRFMSNPVEVSVGKVNTANVNIDHQYFVTTQPHRYETLKRMIDFNPDLYGIIFTRTKMDAQDISDRLTREGYNVDALHGDLNQAQRDRVMNAFRSKALQLVVATDVAARGIDVSGITHVINFELPDDTEVYTHRSGRTGRAGKTGICLSIVTLREQRRIREIEQVIKAKMHRLEIPTGKDVCRKQFFHFMDKLLQADISHGDYETYVPMLSEKFAAISKEEVLQRVAALEFDRFLKYYENAEDLNIKMAPEKMQDRKNSAKLRGGAERSPGNYSRLFVNLGTKDGFYKASFLQYILDLSDLRKDVLGRIDLKNMNSFVEVEKPFAQQMIRAIDGKTYKGRKIRMNEA